MELLRPIMAVFIFCLSLSASVANDWDHFVFAQTWPPAACVEAEHRHIKCQLEKEVSTWVIHGLWPSLRTTHGPTYCNDSSRFNFSQIADLKENLLKYWPNLFQAPHTLWGHEWERHGTCCMDLSTTSGEHNYFATGLSMNRKYDLLKILSEGNVTPNDTAEYKVSDFINAVEKAIGVRPHLSCSVLEQNHKRFTLIGQVKICLKKNLTPMECPHRAEYPANKQNPTFPIENKLGMYDNLGLESCPLKFHYPPIKYMYV